MKIIGKHTTMLDGQKVFDISIPTNSRDQKRVIITCDTKDEAILFIAQFNRLLKKHTIEHIENFDIE